MYGGRSGCPGPGLRFAPTRMRLAVFETAPRGGLLHYATQLADGLASAGHDVDLVVAAGNELAAAQGPARRRAVLTPPVRAGAAVALRPAGAPARRGRGPADPAVGAGSSGRGGAAATTR